MVNPHHILHVGQVPIFHHGLAVQAKSGAGRGEEWRSQSGVSPMIPMMIWLGSVI